MAEAPEQYVAAALIEIAGKYQQGINSALTEIYSLPEKEFGVVIEPQLVDAALKILQRCDIAYISNDPLAGIFVRITDTRANTFFESVAADHAAYEKVVNDASDPHEGVNRAEGMFWPAMSMANDYVVLQRHNQFGSKWIKLAMDELGRPDNALTKAQASDRIVLFSDNMKTVEEIDAGLENIEQAIRSNNEVGSALGDNKEIAASEIGHLRNMLKAGKARRDVLLQYSKQVLGWLSKEVGKTSISELVKHVMKLFLGWLS